jgi:hypothetical protein
MAFIPEIWSQKMAEVFMQASHKWSVYGYTDEWWAVAIERYYAMTGVFPRVSKKGTITPAEYMRGDGTVSRPRLSAALMKDCGENGGYLEEVLRFWIERPGLANLMLPKENEHDQR